MPEKKHLGTITILVKDRQTNSGELNKLLAENGHFILARLGVNLNRSCISNCTAMITVTVEATKKEIKNLTEKINALYGIVAKSVIISA